MRYINRHYLSIYLIEAKQLSSHSNAKAVCWAYFGSIKFCSDDNGQTVLDKTRYYCSLCLRELQSKSTEGKTCHISDIGNFSQQTSSGNLNMHLSNKRGLDVLEEEKVNKIVVNYFAKYSEPSSSTCSAPSQHEFNRDVLLWFTRDLMPYSAVAKKGFTDFFSKYVPTYKLPDVSTLSKTALHDMYSAGLVIVKQFLADIRAVYVMFDSWTDKYNAAFLWDRELVFTMFTRSKTVSKQTREVALLCLQVVNWRKNLYSH